MSELYEKLADIEHQRWSDWMKYQFSLCAVQEDGSMIIPAESVKHWLRQMSADYSDLTEKEKDSDREQVDRYWPLIQARIKALEGAIDKVEENNPWPESVWIMTEQEYIDATPDDRVRTAISGYLMRRGWNLAVEYIRTQLKD